MSVRNRVMSVLSVCLLIAGWSYAAQLTNFSRSFEVSGTPKLVASLSSGEIQVNPGTGARTIQIDVVAIDQQDLQYLDVRQDGNTVVVEFKPQGSRSQRSPRFEFTVPAAANLELSTAGGDISVTGTLTGTVEAKTAGGDISLKDVEGSVKARTAGGDIQAGVVKGDCEITTSGGGIVVEAADGEVVVKTAGGDIKVGDVGRKLEATTAGGDIQLGNVAGSAVVRTAGGDVVVGTVDGSADLKTAGGNISLAAARGSVTASTAGGDLELLQVEGPIKASTAGGDIVAEFLAAAGGSELKTAGGDIELRVASSVRMTVRAVVHVRGDWSREGRDFGIESGFGLAELVRDTAARELRADLPVNGGGPDVFCETSNGWIRVVPLR